MSTIKTIKITHSMTGFFVVPESAPFAITPRKSLPIFRLSGNVKEDVSEKKYFIAEEKSCRRTGGRLHGDKKCQQRIKTQSNSSLTVKKILLIGRWRSRSQMLLSVWVRAMNVEPPSMVMLDCKYH
jgi:hypothetical protein